MGQVKNKFIPKDKKKNKNKKREIKSEVVCVPKLDPEIEAKNRKKNQIVTVAKRAKPLTRTDDYRIFDSHPDGGFALVDQEVISKLRNIAKEVVKRVGSQLLRGKLNLTSVSFPIRCMGKWSHLEALTSIMKVFPYYLTAAAYQTDPVERMKWYMAAMISTHTAVHSFDKPLNPILGETYVCE